MGHNLTITAKDGYKLSARIFESPDAKALVQVVHGMEEHKERYDAFAAYLRQNGFTVLTCDLRGHGADAPVLSHIADRQGHTLLAEDALTLTAYLKEKYPEKPVLLFAHSMGTLIARKVLQKNSADYAGIVLSGYPNPQKIASAGILLSGLIGAVKGAKGHSGLLNGMAMGPFARAVPDAKTGLEWLSFNEDNVRAYQADPLCGVEFTVGSFNALFHLVSENAKAELYENVNAELPVLLISGADDPVTGGEKGRNASLEVLRKAGFRSLKVVTLEHMRHEILQEDRKEEVYQAVCGFLQDACAGGAGRT